MFVVFCGLSIFNCKLFSDPEVKFRLLVSSFVRKFRNFATICYHDLETVPWGFRDLTCQFYRVLFVPHPPYLLIFKLMAVSFQSKCSHFASIARRWKPHDRRLLFASPKSTCTVGDASACLRRFLKCQGWNGQWSPTTGNTRRTTTVTSVHLRLLGSGSSG